MAKMLHSNNSTIGLIDTINPIVVIEIHYIREIPDAPSSRIKFIKPKGIHMSLINTPVQPFKTQAFHNGKFIEVTEQSLKGKWSVMIFMPAAFTFRCLARAA